jgi:hypothetical protein
LPKRREQHELQCHGQDDKDGHECNDAVAAFSVLPHQPQYAVWTPIVAIGVIATVALGIFGQMAKRWKDMNA